MENMNEKVKAKGVALECPKCGHKWEYTGGAKYVHCPLSSCGSFFAVRIHRAK